MDVTDLLVDEVQVPELNYALGIPHIYLLWRMGSWTTKDTKQTHIYICTESEEAKVLQFHEEISDAHKCNLCYTLLCCGSYLFHDVNCWFNDFQGTLSLVVIWKIYR